MRPATQPEISEGWVGGESSWRAYAISAMHGQRHVKVSMPHDRWSAMTTPQREAWCRDARRRVSTGRLER